MATNLDDLKVTLSLDGANFMITATQAGRVVRNLQSQIEGLGGGVARIEQHLNSAAAGFRRFVITLGALRFIMMDIQDVFLSLPAAILKTSGEVERMTKLMEGLSTASTTAGKKLEALQNTQFVFAMAQNAPFEVKALQDAFVKLKTGGLDPTKGSLQALVDSVAKFGGSSEQLKRASIAIQQMGGKGVVSMEELRQQLGEAVPNAIQMMATGMKMGMADLVKAISKGTVEAQSAMSKMFAVMAIMNRGAADEMMKTWVGILAQMSTRWELFKNAVGEAGFADAAKDAAKQINDLLSSPEGKRFATELGQGLASLVKSLVSFAQWLGENITLLKIIGGLLVSTFATTRIVDFIARTGAGLRGMWETQRNEILRNKHEKEVALQQSLRNEVVAINARKELLLTEVAANRAQQGTLLAQRAQYLAEVQALESAFRANAAGRMVNAQTGRFASAAAIAENNTLIAQRRALADAAQREANQLAILNAGYVNQANTAKTLATEKAALADKTLKAAGAANYLTGILSAGKFAWMMIGGWIGAISLALTFGIPLWNKYANSAEDALKRIKNAVNTGTADEDILKSVNTELDTARRELAAAKRTSAALAKDPKASKEERQQRAEEEIRLNQRILDLETQQAEAAEQVRNSNAVKAGESWRKAATTEIEAIRQAGKTKADEIMAQAAQDRLTGKALDEAKQKALKAGLEAEIAESEKLNEIAIAARARMKNATSDSERRAAEVEFNRASKEARDQAERVANLQKDLNKDNVTVSTKNNKDKSGNSSFESFLDAQRRSAAELRFKIAKWEEDSITEADLFAAAVRKVQDLRKAGMLKAKNKDGTERDLTDEEQAIAQQEAFINEKLRVAEDGIKRMREIYNTAQAVSQSNIERRGQDPALVGLTTGSTAADILINRLSSKMEIVKSILAESGQNWEDWVGRIKAATEASDLSRWLEGSAKTVADINASLKEAGSGSRFENEREAAAKKISDAQKQAEKLISIERARRKTNYEEEEQAAMNIALINKNLADQILAINSKLAYDTRGPILKMAQEWQNITERMEAAGAGWINGFVDMFVDGLEEGKFAFKDFATSILKEITKLMMQKVVGQFVSQIVGGMMGGAAGGQNTDGSWGMVDTTGFAKGGIMTSKGRLELNSYANGGIAKTPQLAMFGEGRMNEAYVPLPDGRRIPVAMQGSAETAQPSVQVNVINQTGTQADAKTSTRFDGRQMILDVVLTAVGTPGPFRDNMKQAMR